MKKFLAFLFFAFLSIQVSSAPIGIKNVDPNFEGFMSKQEVYWIYTLKTRFWADGTKITVFYLDFDNPVHIAFVKNVLGSTPNSFQNSVNTYINVGNAAYFRKASSEIEVWKQVSRTPGAVGYISDQTLLINSGDNRVRVIRITD